jgi:hypothetical protein
MVINFLNILSSFLICNKNLLNVVYDLIKVIIIEISTCLLSELLIKLIISLYFLLLKFSV